MKKLTYDFEKNVEILNYLSTFYSKKEDLLAFLFLADRYHLLSYGKPISECQGNYLYTKNGPVAYSILSFFQLDVYPISKSEEDYLCSKVKISSSSCTSLSEPDNDFLSESELETISIVREKVRNEKNLVDYVRCIFPNIYGEKIDLKDFFSINSEKDFVLEIEQDRRNLNAKIFEGENGEKYGPLFD